jgi:phosphate transport system substrate-binding protein
MIRIHEKNKMLLQLRVRICRLRFFWPMNPALLGMLLFTAMIVAGPLPVPAHADTIRLGGTGGALGAMKLLAKEFKKARPGDTVIVLPSMGSSGGIKAALSGALDIGLSSRPLTDAEQGRGLIGREYARTPLVIAVAKKNGASGFSLQQVTDIYAGKTRTWPDGTPLRLVMRPASEFDTTLLKSMSSDMNRAVQDALSRKGMIMAVTDQDSADAIEKIPGALGTTTLAQIISEKRALKKLSLNGIDPGPKTIADGTYPYFKTFYLITGPNPSPLARQFITFILSARGREILTGSGHWVAGR